MKGSFTLTNRRRLHILLAAAASFLAFIAFVVLSVWLLLNTSLAERWFIKRVQAAVAARWGIAVEIQSVRSNLLSWARAEGITLQTTSPDSAEFLHIAEVKLAYNLTSLISRRFDIEQITFVNPQIRLTSDSSGRLVQPFITPTDDYAAGTRKPIVRVIVKRIEVVNGIAALFLPDSAEVQFAHSALIIISQDTAQFSITGSGDYRSTSRKLAWRNLSLKGIILNGTVIVDTLSAFLPDLILAGRCSLYDDFQRLSGQVHLKGDPDSLLRDLLPSTFKDTETAFGSINAITDFDGELRNINIATSVEVESLSVKDCILDVATITAAAELEPREWKIDIAAPVIKYAPITDHTGGLSATLTASGVGDSIRVHQLVLHAPNAALELTGKYHGQRRGGSYSSHIDFRGELGELLSSFFPTGNEDTILSGNIHLAADVSGSIRANEHHIVAKASGVHLFGQPLSKLRINADWKNNIADITELSAEFDGSKWLLKGEYLPRSGQYRISADFSDTPADYFWKLTGKPIQPLSALLSGSMRLKGDAAGWRSLTGDGNLNIKAVYWREKLLADFQANAVLSGGNLDFAARLGASKIEGRVGLAHQRLHGMLSARVDDLSPIAELAAQQSISGKANAFIVLSGTVKSPHLEGHLSLSEAQWRELPIDSARASVTWSDGRFTINNAVAAGSCQEMSLPNSLPNDGVERLNYMMAVKGSLPDLYGWADFDFKALWYRGFKADSGRGSIKIDTDSFLQGGFELFSDSVGYSGNVEWNVQDSIGKAIVLIALPDSAVNPDSLKLTAVLSDDSSVGLSVFSPSIPVGSVEALYPLRLGLSGRASVELSLQGLPDKPTGMGEVHWCAPTISGIEADSLTLQATVSPSRLGLEFLNIYKAGSHTRAEGWVDLSYREKALPQVHATNLFKFSAEADTFDIALLKALLPNDAQAGGAMKFTAVGAGTISDPRLQADCQLSEGYLTLRSGVGGWRGINGRIALNDTIMQIQHLAGMLKETRWSASGWIIKSASGRRRFNADLSMNDSPVSSVNGWMDEDSLNVLLRSESFDLSEIKPLLHEFRTLEGRLVVELHLKGARKSPDLSGRISGAHLALQPAAVDLQLSNGSLLAVAENKRLKLERLQFDAGETGSLSAGGWAMLSPRPVDSLMLHIRAIDVPVAKAKYFDGNVAEAELTLTGVSDNLQLTGSVQLNKTKIVRNLQAADLIAKLPSASRAGLESAGKGVLLKLNVRVHNSPDILVDNNVARLTLSPEIVIEGTSSAPIPTGRLEIASGQVFYLDREFSITRGILDFVDPERINPIIDIAAETVIRSYQNEIGVDYFIQLKITGPADMARLTLESNPPLSNPDIVTLLTVGITREQLAGRYSEGQGAALSDVLKRRLEVYSSRRISGVISEKVGTALGLKQMEIEGNLFNLSGRSAPQLHASKSISKRLELSYSTSVGHLNDQNIQLEYALTNRVSIAGQTDQRGAAGIDVKYRLRFK